MNNNGSAVYRGYIAFTHRHHYPRLHYPVLPRSHEHDAARERDTARFALISAIHNDSNRVAYPIIIALEDTSFPQRACAGLSLVFKIIFNSRNIPNCSLIIERCN